MESTSGHNTSPVLPSIITSSSIMMFSKSLPCKFSHCVFYQLLIIYFLINGLLLSKFIQTLHTGGGIGTKNNLLILCDGFFYGFFKVFLCFHCSFDGAYSTFLQVLAKTSCSFIISFVTPGRLQKSLKPSFYTSKNLSL